MTMEKSRYFLKHYPNWQKYKASLIIPAVTHQFSHLFVHPKASPAGLQAAIITLPQKQTSFLVCDHNIHQKIARALEIIYFWDTI